MMMLSEARKFLNENRLYAWMLVFVILFSAGVNMFSSSPKYEVKKKERAAESRRLYDEIQGRLKVNEAKLRALMSTRKDLTLKMGAFAFGLIGSFLFGLGLLVMFANAAYKDRRVFKSRIDISLCRWGLADVAKVMILFLFLSQLLFILQFGIINALGLKKYGGGLSGVLNTTIMDLFVFFVIIYMVREYHKGSLRALGLKLGGFFKNIAVGIAGYMATIPILFAVLLITMGLIKITNFKPPMEPVFEMFFEEKRTYILSYLSIFVALVGPIVEEVFFRGFAYPAVKRRVGRWKAIILVSGFFALLHTNLVGFLPIFILGVLLVALYERTGSLVPSIAVHMLHNSLMVYLMFFVKELAAV